MIDSFNICDCRCHDESPGFTVRHIMPCCTRCDVCDQNIKISYEAHVIKCSAQYDKQMEEIMGKPLNEEDRKILNELRKIQPLKRRKR